MDEKRAELASAAAKAALLGAVGLYANAKDGKINLRSPEATAVFKSIAYGMVVSTDDLDGVMSKLVSSVMDNAANNLEAIKAPTDDALKVLESIQHSVVMALLIYVQVLEVVKEKKEEEKGEE